MSAMAKVVQKNPSGAAHGNDICFSIWLRFVHISSKGFLPQGGFLPHVTLVPVMNGHPRDQAKVSVHCRWPLIRGNLTLKCVGWGIGNVAVQGRWPLTTGVAQGRYYCILVIT